MKRTIRLLATVLSAAALVCAASVPASAATGYLEYHTNPNADFNFIGGDLGSFEIKDVKQKVTYAPDRFIYEGKNVYELMGSTITDYNGLHEKVSNGKTQQTLDPSKHWGMKDGKEQWLYDLVFAYGDHEHSIAKNAPWNYDNNHHWKWCKECEQIAYINWHHDVDNNGKCDECGDDIYYRYVTVKDVPGGKVEVSKEKCMLGNRVSVTVTPDAGYKLQEIHGVNDNEKRSPRPCIVDVKGSQYHMFVDVWDIEVQPTFVKE